MRILITGATGFIGGHLMEALTQMGHEYMGMDDMSINGYPEWIDEFMEDNSNVQLVLGGNGDCANSWNLHSEMKKFRPNVIFNLAVMPLPHSLIEPADNVMTNIKITMNILEQMRTRMGDEIKLIHFSSSEVYGTIGNEDNTMDESCELRPITPYAASKTACDQLVLSYVRTFGIDAIIVRPFNTIGPRQNENTYAAVVPLTIRRILNGESPMIYGDGLQTRDFNYVDDIVDGAIRAMERGKTGEIYNLCSGKETSISNLIDMICDEMDYHGNVKMEDERRGDVRRHIGDGDKAKYELGWKPRTPLKDAIRKTVGWYTCTKQ